MAAVTQMIDSFLGGVSRQSDDKKRPGQVVECINGYADPTYGLVKRPGTEFISRLDAAAGTTSDWFYIHRDNGEKYVGTIGASFGSQNIELWNATTGVACTITMTGSPSPNNYISDSTTTERVYDVVTAQDTTIIVNRKKTVAVTANPSFTSKSKATLMLSGSPVSVTYTVVLGTTNITVTGDENSTYDSILTSLDSQIDSLSGFSTTKLSNSLEIERSDTFTISASAGDQNDKLTVFQDEVDNISQLPTQSKNNRVVKIINTASDQDTYFVKFIADNGTSGTGHWEETIDPSKSTGFDASTMPHELINTDTNEFTFRAITWVNRLVGDDVTNNHPSFVSTATEDRTIRKVFFHNNRLGFLSKDNVILSQAGDFYNFYHTSARALTEADPVDLNCSTTRPAVLYNVIPTAQGLILFSKSQQFLMSGKDGLLTPTTATINAISNFESSTDIEPIDMGTHIDFVSKQPKYSRVFSLNTRGQQENPKIVDISRIVIEWIPGTITNAVASPQNNLLALYSTTFNTSTGYNSEIYLYRTHDEGERRVIQSWFSWKINGLLKFLAFDNDDFYMVTTSTPTGASDVLLSKGSLSRSPEDALIASSKGDKINPYIDLYTSPRNQDNDLTNAVVYDGTNQFNKIYVPYNTYTSLGQEPIVIIKGDTQYFSAIDGSITSTSSAGMVIEPTEVVTESSGDIYFKVPGKKDLSSLSDRIIAGVKYKFNIELPRTYFRTDEGMTRSDYTASLVVKRVNFSLGLSGSVNFRLKSIGNTPTILAFTGNGTKKIFDWLPRDFKYRYRDQVSVKVNGIEQRPQVTGVSSSTGFEWIDNRKIEFRTAPPPDASIEISKLEWDLAVPTIKAGKYLADDVNIDDHSIFSLPIHQKASNFSLKVTDDTPYPVSLNSMTWEGNYSPRFYRRTY